MSNPSTRRQFIKSSVLGVGAALLGPSLSGCNRPAARPNVIFLLTDDQRWDTMGCMGNKLVHTPNMDALAAGGVLFTNAFVTTAICGASRASILTGQYERRHGVRGFGPFSDEVNMQTYPMLLKSAGYRVGFIGKYGVENPPKDQYDYWDATEWQPKYEHTDANGNYKHFTSLCGDEAIEFLDGCTPEQPFCLSVSFKAPHVQDTDPRQFIYDPAYKDMYKDVEFPVPETAGDEYFYGVFPEWFTKDNEARRRWNMRFETPEHYQESVRGYHRLIYGVDVVIGRIRKHLEELGQADNTVIMLMGDNGFYLAEHGMAGKWYGHEESIRVPLVVFDPRQPQAKRGQTREEMALNIDMAPTILDLTGVTIPGRMQGQSLVPLLNGKSPQWRDEFFYEHRFARKPGEPVIPQSEGVVGKRYKYLRYIEYQPLFEELYDLQNDPHEKHNLAKDPNYQELLQSLRTKCDDLRDKAV